MRAIRVLLTISLLLCPLLLQAKGVVRTRYRVVRRSRVRRHVRRLVFRSPIRGSRESLLRQNERLDEDDVQRIQDDDELLQLEQTNKLVALPEDRAVTIAGTLPDERRFCRPWTAEFVQDFAADFYKLFRQALKVTSAVRTAETQKRLLLVNRNAAAVEGDLASPHLSGATIDITKKGMTSRQLAWARKYLLGLQNSGVLDVEEEFHQAVFHITVYRSYLVASEKTAAGEAAQ